MMVILLSKLYNAITEDVTVMRYSFLSVILKFVTLELTTLPGSLA